MSYVIHGRCRSGSRWFWIAAALGQGETCKCDDPVCVYGGLHEYGWEDTEDLALKAMAEAVARLGGEIREGCYRGNAPGSAGAASSALRRINAARRAARPPSGSTDAGRAEYLYGTRHYWPDDGLGTEVREVIPFRITRRTARRVYYIRSEHGPGDIETGHVDRLLLDREGRVRRRSAGWWDDDFELYATREAAEASLGLGEAAGTAPDVRQLRRAMAGAHPDRGGTSQEFIAARERYQRALRRAS